MSLNVRAWLKPLSFKDFMRLYWLRGDRGRFATKFPLPKDVQKSRWHRGVGKKPLPLNADPLAEAGGRPLRGATLGRTGLAAIAPMRVMVGLSRLRGLGQGIAGGGGHTANVWNRADAPQITGLEGAGADTKRAAAGGAQQFDAGMNFGILPRTSAADYAAQVERFKTEAGAPPPIDLRPRDPKSAEGGLEADDPRASLNPPKLAPVKVKDMATVIGGPVVDKRAQAMGATSGATPAHGLADMLRKQHSPLGRQLNLDVNREVERPHPREAMAPHLQQVQEEIAGYRQSTAPEVIMARLALRPGRAMPSVAAVQKLANDLAPVWRELKRSSAVTPISSDLEEMVDADLLDNPLMAAGIERMPAGSRLIRDRRWNIDRNDVENLPDDARWLGFAEGDEPPVSFRNLRNLLTQLTSGRFEVEFGKRTEGGGLRKMLAEFPARPFQGTTGRRRKWNPALYNLLQTTDAESGLHRFINLDDIRSVKPVDGDTEFKPWQGSNTTIPAEAREFATNPTRWFPQGHGPEDTPLPPMSKMRGASGLERFRQWASKSQGEAGHQFEERIPGGPSQMITGRRPGTFAPTGMVGGLVRNIPGLAQHVTPDYTAPMTFKQKPSLPRWARGSASKMQPTAKPLGFADGDVPASNRMTRRPVAKGLPSAGQQVGGFDLRGFRGGPSALHTPPGARDAKVESALMKSSRGGFDDPVVALPDGALESLRGAAVAAASGRQLPSPVGPRDLFRSRRQEPTVMPIDPQGSGGLDLSGLGLGFAGGSEKIPLPPRPLGPMLDRMGQQAPGQGAPGPVIPPSNPQPPRGSISKLLDTALGFPGFADGDSGPFDPRNPFGGVSNQGVNPNIEDILDDLLQGDRRGMLAALLGAGPSALRNPGRPVDLPPSIPGSGPLATARQQGAIARDVFSPGESELVQAPSERPDKLPGRVMPRGDVMHPAIVQRIADQLGLTMPDRGSDLQAIAPDVMDPPPVPQSQRGGGLPGDFDLNPRVPARSTPNVDATVAQVPAEQRQQRQLRQQFPEQLFRREQTGASGPLSEQNIADRRSQMDRMLAAGPGAPRVPSVFADGDSPAGLARPGGGAIKPQTPQVMPKGLPGPPGMKRVNAQVVNVQTNKPQQPAQSPQIAQKPASGASNQQTGATGPRTPRRGLMAGIRAGMQGQRAKEGARLSSRMGAGIGRFLGDMRGNVGRNALGTGLLGLAGGIASGGLGALAGLAGGGVLSALRGALRGGPAPAASGPQRPSLMRRFAAMMGNANPTQFSAGAAARGPSNLNHFRAMSHRKLA